MVAYAWARAPIWLAQARLDWLVLSQKLAAPSLQSNKYHDVAVVKSKVTPGTGNANAQLSYLLYHRATDRLHRVLPLRDWQSAWLLQNAKAGVTQNDLRRLVWFWVTNRAITRGIFTALTRVWTSANRVQPSRLQSYRIASGDKAP